MFESRLANVIAYGGLALVILVPASDYLLGLMEKQQTPVIETAAQAEVSEPEAATLAPVAPALPDLPATASVETPPAPSTPARELIRPGQRIVMTEDQIRWPDKLGTERPAAAASSEAGAAGMPPIPRPRPEHQPTQKPTPKPTPVVVPVQAPAPVVLGAPERPLGTMPAQGFPSHPVPPQPIQPRGNAVESMRGWTDGSLEDYLRRQQSGEGRVDDRFIPPANVGY